jgi:hypothetical protein
MGADTCWTDTWLIDWQGHKGLVLGQPIRGWWAQVLVGLVRDLFDWQGHKGKVLDRMMITCWWALVCVGPVARSLGHGSWPTDDKGWWAQVRVGPVCDLLHWQGHKGTKAWSLLTDNKGLMGTQVRVGPVRELLYWQGHKGLVLGRKILTSFAVSLLLCTCGIFAKWGTKNT